MNFCSLKLNWLQVKVLLVVIASLGLITCASATPFTLKSLKPTGSNTQIQKNGLATVTMIFQPKCSWCKKQGIAMAKILEKCNHSLNIALIGAKGNRRQLKQALKHYHKAIPAFIADSRFLRKIGGYQASPTTLIYSVNGELIFKKRGFIEEKKLRKVLQMLTQDACKI